MSTLYKDLKIIKDAHPMIEISKGMYENIKKNSIYKRIKLDLLTTSTNESKDYYPVLYSFNNKLIVFEMAHFAYLDNLLKFNYHILIFISKNRLENQND